MACARMALAIEVGRETVVAAMGAICCGGGIEEESAILRPGANTPLDVRFAGTDIAGVHRARAVPATSTRD